MGSSDSDSCANTVNDWNKREAILICVPSGVLTVSDWLKGDLMAVVVDLFVEVLVVVTGGLGCWKVGSWSDEWAIFSAMVWG